MSNNTRPLFSEGEEVILASQSKPEKNGFYTVRKVLPYGSKYVCRHSGMLITKTAPSAGYLLEEVLTLGNSVGGKIIEQPWAQTALKKKYPPSSQSFSELMNSLLTTPVTQS